MGHYILNQATTYKSSPGIAVLTNDWCILKNRVILKKKKILKEKRIVGSLFSIVTSQKSVLVYPVYWLVVGCAAPAVPRQRNLSDLISVYNGYNLIMSIKQSMQRALKHVPMLE